MEIIGDRYELRSEIRRGGFGVTWYGWDKSLDMPVAIKEFSDPDPEHRGKFLREARTLAQFSGFRGIVNVRDFLQTQDKVYMVMEYLDGEDLSTYVDKKGRLSFEETMRLLNPVMDVLARLHAVDMLHRDVSPDNIRLTGDGDVKLLDFGSASNMTSENLTRTITVKPGYAPIEQYSGAVQQGPWTDVYSLCATIYKCITGRKPADSLVRSFHDDVELPSALGAAISPAEEAVLMKGFSVQPAERYASVDAFREAMAGAKNTAAAAEENRKLEELAALAFSDEVGPAPAAAGTAKPDSADAGTAKAETAAEQKHTEAAAGTAAVGMSGDWNSAAGTGSGASAEGSAGRKPAESSGSSVSGAGHSARKNAAAADKKKKSGKVLIPIVLGLALVAGIAFFHLRGSTGEGGGVLPDLPTVVTGVPDNVDYKSGDRYISFQDTEITDEDIAFINSQEAINTVSFYRCQLSDEIVGKMPELSKIKSVSFSNCGGFTSLNPLAEMPALDTVSVYVNRDETFSGDELFTTDFPKQLTGFNLNCGDITGSTDFLRHFPGLTSLTFGVESDGKDMSFLEAMPELEYLYIIHQTMDEKACSHLFGHPKLQSVMFEDSPLATLEWARECADLYKIDADDSNITDLGPLAGHEKLAIVDLSGAPVSDLSPLADCMQLFSLTIDHSEVESLAPLAGHERLGSLNVSFCHVSDLSPLSGTGLESLAAAHNEITTLKPLASCTKMLSLNVNGNALSNLEGCEEMIKLAALRAADNRISDISAIRNCALLEELQLSNNEISDLSALGNDFEELTLLDITDNNVSDISVLSSCTKLAAFAAADNNITSLRGLEDKPELMAVLISGNSVSDLSPLSGSLNKLSYLDFGSNQVSDLSVLKGLAVKNVWLLMEKNKISDLSPLPSLLSYRKMAFYGNPIKDLSFVTAMTNVNSATELYLSYQTDSDYAVLGESAFRYSAYLVDVPTDKKAAVLKDFKEGSGFTEPNFMTTEEADKEMAESRKEIRKAVVGNSAEEEEASE